MNEKRLGTRFQVPTFFRLCLPGGVDWEKRGSRHPIRWSGLQVNTSEKPPHIEFTVYLDCMLELLEQFLSLSFFNVSTRGFATIPWSKVKGVGTIYDMGGWLMAIVTSLGNGPMDSVQVGKAVFVKRELHYPGNQTQDLLLSREVR